MTPFDVLWTGGWDSTYRVLDLVVARGRTVQPHYIVDTGRPSIGHEIRAMAAIRTDLADRCDPALLLPTRLVETSAVPENEELTAKFRRLRERAPLGVQYEILARYAESASIDALELSIHVDDRAFVFVSDHVEQVEEQGEPNYRLQVEGIEPDLSLFARFRFPILHVSKVQMGAAARELGIERMMNKTWFCHRPRGDRPCGTCLPCGFTIEEGMAHRLPLSARLKGRFVKTRAGTMTRRALARLRGL